VAGAGINRGWSGGEFTPGNRLASMDQSGARTKRYSSQRLRTAAGDSAMSDAAGDSVSPTTPGTATQLVNATSMVRMPSRPVPSSAFFGIYPYPSYLSLAGWPLTWKTWKTSSSSFNSHTSNKTAVPEQTVH